MKWVSIMKNTRKAMKQNMEQQEVLSSDVIMFCSLLARIIYRCLIKRGAHPLDLLSEPAGDDPGECDVAVIEDSSEVLSEKAKEG